MTEEPASRVGETSQERHQYLLPVLHLTIDCLWQIGPVQLHPAGSTFSLVNREREKRGWRHDWYDDHLDEHEVAELDSGTVALVEAADGRAAYDLVSDAIGVLRLFQPTRSPMADVESQTFGLAGEVEQWRASYLRLDSGPAASWFHGGAHPGWTFTGEDYEAFVSDHGWQFLAGSIEPAGRDITPIEARLRLGSRLLNAAFLDYDADRKLLSLMTAIEVVLGESAWRTKKYGLARRAAFLSCSVPQNSMCGRDRNACPYLALRVNSDGGAQRALGEFVRRARRDSRVQCSRYLEFLRFYEARNAAIHGGTSGLTFDDVKGLSWRVNQWLVPRLLVWSAEHPAGDIGAIEEDIATAVANRPPAPIPPDESTG